AGVPAPLLPNTVPHCARPPCLPRPAHGPHPVLVGKLLADLREDSLSDCHAAHLRRPQDRHHLRGDRRGDWGIRRFRERTWLPHSGLDFAVAHAAGIRRARLVDDYEYRAPLRNRVHRTYRGAVGAAKLEPARRRGAMKSPIRKAAPGKRSDAKGQRVKSKRHSGVRGDQRGLHLLGGRASTHQRSGESLGDFAYRIMREAIRSGKFRSGEHLREADVAEWLNISRTPVREAFHRIISEGLLTNGPWNGVMMAELDAQQLVQLYAVRAALEGTAAALAAQ